MNAGLRPPRPINNKRQNWRDIHKRRCLCRPPAANILRIFFPVLCLVFVCPSVFVRPSSLVVTGWDPTWRRVAIHHHLEHSSLGRGQDKNNTIILTLERSPWRPASPKKFRQPGAFESSIKTLANSIIHSCRELSSSSGDGASAATIWLFPESHWLYSTPFGKFIFSPFFSFEKG